MTNGKDIVKLFHELDMMPEKQLEVKIRALDRSRYVFNQNYSQLRNLLLVEKDTEQALKLWDGKNQDAHDAYRLEATRLFHNFVVSVKSLIDHSRILYNDLYKENNKFPDYQKEITTRFIENPFAQFVEDLRDYSLHFKLPPIFSEITYKSDPPRMECGTRLDIRALENGFNWSSPAKKYLEEQKIKIKSSSQIGDNMSLNLLVLIEEYYSIVVDFHKWLLTRQNEIHSEEFGRLGAKTQTLRELIIPEEIATALTDMKMSKNPDEAFYRLLNHEQRIQPNQIPIKSISHVEKLLEFIKQQAFLAKS